MTITVLSYGMGVDSTAILLRWIHEPETRPAGLGGLDDLIVVTAQTGSEYPETIRLVEEHVLPLLRAHGIRFVELAKGGPTKADGVKVLQDSREPVRLHPDGAYRLVDELTDSGTVPQYGGTRKCSIKFKGEPIDEWLAGNLPPGRFTHVVGYEADEKKRAEKDTKLGATNKLVGHRRDPSYPLIDWGWNRARCLDYIKATTGAEWAKSACTFCPFAEDRGVGRVSCEEAVLTLKLEAVANALNPRQTLFVEKKKLALPASARETYERLMPEAYEAFVTEICDGDWTVYEVRRVWTDVGAKGEAGVGGNSARELTHLVARGTAEECKGLLEERAAVMGLPVSRDDNGFHLIDVAPKPDFGNGVEHRIVVAPTAAVEKRGRTFNGLETRVGKVVGLTPKRRYLAALDEMAA